MTTPTTERLGALIDRNHRPREPGADDKVWNLNLDQIEPHSGRVLAKRKVSTSDLGPSTFAFDRGTVLYSKLRPYLNKVMVADDAGVATTELVPLRCDASRMCAHYLAHFLRGPEFLQFATNVVAGAKMPRMVMSEFWKFPVPIPPLPEQRRIAAILDQADALRAKRREALAQLDSLTQSIFIEMFGDPELGRSSVPVTTLGKVCLRITDGTHQTPKWESSGVPFIFISNIVQSQINFNTNKYISEATYNELTRRCPIELGDVLYTTVGSYGNVALVGTSKKFAFQRHIAHIKPDHTKVAPTFCAAMLRSPVIRRQVDRVARGVAQKTVNLSDLSALRVFEPPMRAQQQFALRADAIESVRASHVSSLAALDSLFDSLQHRAFAGQL